MRVLRRVGDFSFDVAIAKINDATIHRDDVLIECALTTVEDKVSLMSTENNA
jgi:hypothetical protein